MNILKNEGPWGNSGSGGGSNNNGGGKNPWGGRAPGGGPKGPDFDKIFENIRDKFGGGSASGPGKASLLLIALAVVAVYLASGIYRVQQDEKAVILRFGKWVNTTEPGLRYRLPFPFEEDIKIKTTAVNQVEIGFRTDARGIAQDVESESRMITGDKNFIDVDFAVYWMIKDPAAFLFNVRNPIQAVKDAAESAMRDVMGNTPIQRAMTDGREEIAGSVRDLLQSILDSYNAGIKITSVAPKSMDSPKPVVDAFNEVLRASADRDRLKNEAETYRNNIIPVARGEAEKINQDALAYKESVVNKAKGDAQRFTSVYDSYKLAKDVTTTRLYLETMEEVLKNSSKIVLGDGKSGGGVGPVVPYLPLPEIKRQQTTPIKPAPIPEAAPAGEHVNE